VAVSLCVLNLIDQFRARQPLDIFKFVDSALALLHYATQFGVEDGRIGAFHDLAVLELLCGVNDDVCKYVAELAVVRYGYSDLVPATFESLARYNN